jgi:hypothetical protein
MPIRASPENRGQARSSTDPACSQAGMRSAFSRAMRLVYQSSCSCLVLAAFAVFAPGCHDGSGSNKSKLGADAAAGSADATGRVPTSDAGVSPDTSTASAPDASAIIDSRGSSTVDAAAGLDTRLPGTVDVAESTDTRVPNTVDAVANADQSVLVTTDGSAHDLRQGDAVTIPNRDGSSLPDAGKDTQASGQWFDDAGVCRSNQISTFTRSCRTTLQEAVSAGAPVGQVKSGWCGDMLVWISYATPSLGCGYDSTGSTLIAQYFGDDVYAYCGRASYSVSTPNWPSTCLITPVDAGPAAP